MSRCDILSVALPPIGTNCYFMTNRDTKETIIVDPVSNPDALADMMKEREMKPVAIFLTHGHFDHILQAPELAEKLNLPIYGSEEELPMFTNPDVNMTKSVGRAVSLTPDVLLHDGDVINVAGFDIKIISTPGHTKGSICYYLEEQKILISGDTLFCCDFGRTDFPGGSMEELTNSIIKKLFVLPDDVSVYPGHEEETLLGLEKKRNSILQFKRFVE